MNDLEVSFTVHDCGITTYQPRLGDDLPRYLEYLVESGIGVRSGGVTWLSFAFVFDGPFMDMKDDPLARKKNGTRVYADGRVLSIVVIRRELIGHTIRSTLANTASFLQAFLEEVTARTQARFPDFDRDQYLDNTKVLSERALMAYIPPPWEAGYEAGE
jgi:hypothetical protein